MAVTFAYCLAHGVLGVGWRVALENTNDWERYLEKATEVHGSLQVCKYIKRWVSEGDLVWARDTSGRYYLARVTSGWEYWTCEEAEREDIDIANIFRCDIKRVEIDAVPGKVVASFRARRSIQEVASASAFEYSKHLWNQMVGGTIYEINYDLCRDIFMLLDAEETEDVLFLFLQSQGWYVIPHSRKKDTMAFEYLLVQPKTGEIAAAQVKTGGSGLNRDDYAEHPHRVFLFQATDCYTGGDHPNVTCFSSDVMRNFLSDSRLWLPKGLRAKLLLSELSEQRVV